MKNSKINVLHVIDKLSMDGVNPSSCTKLFAEWIPRFDKNAFNIKVCTLRDPDPAGKLLEDLKIPVFYVNKGKVSPGNIKEISHLIEAENIDIVHLHGYSAANFGRIAARKEGIKNIVHEHAILKVLPHQYLADYFLRNQTDVGVAVCDAVKQFMISGRKVPEEKIKVIFNGIDLKKYNPVSSEEIAGLRKEFKIQKDFRIVGTITRLRKEKGNHVFIQAMPGILEKDQKIIFMIVGEGSEKENLQNLARKYNVLNHIIFTGFRMDVNALLHLFDIKVIPSLTEGFPLAFLEAMASGKAIVASAVGSIEEISIDGETALLVPSNDAEQLMQKIVLLLENEDLRKNLMHNAYKEVQNYSIEANVSALKELYFSLTQ